MFVIITANQVKLQDFVGKDVREFFLVQKICYDPRNSVIENNSVVIAA